MGTPWYGVGQHFFLAENESHIYPNVCQIWLRSDSRVEKGGGEQTDRQTKGRCKLYIVDTLLKVVSHYDLSVLSMSVMGFQKKVWMGFELYPSLFFYFCKAP